MPCATIELLRSQMPDGATNQLVQRISKFAVIPKPIIENLAKQALAEVWDQDLFVLEKYLAAHLGWSVEQGRVTFSDRQFFMGAGSLQTRYGTPIYMVFQRTSEAPTLLGGA